MPNLVKIYSVVPEKNLKMFKSLRTTHDDGQTQKAIFLLSDSGDLKTCTAVSSKKKMNDGIYDIERFMNERNINGLR